MFCQRLNQLLQKQGISALALAKDIGVPKSIVYEWKAGKRSPSAENMRKMSEYFGVSLSYLMGKESEGEEEELLLLLRQAKQLSPQDHADLVASFKQSLDLYLRTKQGSKNDR